MAPSTPAGTAWSGSDRRHGPLGVQRSVAVPSNQPVNASSRLWRTPSVSGSRAVSDRRRSYGLALDLPQPGRGALEGRQVQREVRERHGLAETAQQASAANPEATRSRSERCVKGCSTIERRTNARHAPRARFAPERGDAPSIRQGPIAVAGLDMQARKRLNSVARFTQNSSAVRQERSGRCVAPQAVRAANASCRPARNGSAAMALSSPSRCILPSPVARATACSAAFAPSGLPSNTVRASGTTVA